MLTRNQLEELLIERLDPADWFELIPKLRGKFYEIVQDWLDYQTQDKIVELLEQHKIKPK